MRRNAEPMSRNEPREASFNSLQQIQELAREFGALAQRLNGLEWPDPAFDVQSIRDLIRVWSELLSNTYVQEDYALIPESIAADHWLTPETLNFLERSVHVLLESLDEVFVPQTIDAEAGKLRSTLQSILSKARRPPLSRLEGTEYRDLVGHIDLVIANFAASENQRLWRLQDRAEDAVVRTETAANAASLAAGLTGDATMASFYTSLAAEEKASADSFRRLTVIMAFTAAGSAALFVLGQAWGAEWLDIPPGDYVHLIQRAVFVAGLFGLAGYFARQAHQHRSMANWSRSLAVQLQTFDAYLAGIESPEVRDGLRVSFSARAFGDHPQMKGEPSVTPSAAAMDTAVEWAAKLASGGK